MSPMVQLARRDVRLKHHNWCQGPRALNFNRFESCVERNTLVSGSYAPGAAICGRAKK
jgi:hypothetical protein